MSHQTTRTDIVELRQYTLRGGQRDTLASLFEREFVHTQEEVGIQVFGRFVDRDDPDRFVWMRGFSDMETRGRALTDFYDGPTWKRHGKAANTTMVDSDNVLLLRPVEDPNGVRADLTIGTGRVRATIHYLHGVRADTFAEFWTDTLSPAMTATGYSPVRPLVSADFENNFPRLPVRSDPVFVWFSVFDDETHEREFARWWASRHGWRDHLNPDVMPALMRKPEILHLSAAQESVESAGRNDE